MRWWRSVKVRVHARFGRRASVLALIGIIWFTYGFTIFTSPTPGNQFGRLAGPLNVALTHVWSGVPWVVCGAVAVSVAVLRRRKADALGFNALLVPPLLWMVLYLWSWFMWLVTHGCFGSGRSWVWAVVWSSAVVVIGITSGWPDPVTPEEADLP